MPPHGFHDCCGQCIRGRIHNEDEINTHRVLAHERDRASQIE
jgi:hypothetical protein